MNRILCLLTLIVTPLLLAPVARQPRSVGKSPLFTAPTAATASLFVANAGQFPPPVRYQLQAGRAILWFTDNAIWISLVAGGQRADVQLELPPGVRLTPVDQRPTAVAYHGGGYSLSHVPVWGGVRYDDPASGFHLALQDDDGRLTLTQRGPAPIVNGAADYRLDGDGLWLATAVGPIRFPAASYRPKATGDGLLYGTFVGGSLTDEGTAVAVDAAGNAYITGYTSSLDFPTAAGLAPARHGVDVYLAKIQPDGAGVDYIIWINPNPGQPDDEDAATGIAVDATGNAYLAGRTKSPVFCQFLASVPGYDTSHNGDFDAFVIKIKPDGSGPEYCTYLGGNDLDLANAIAVDGAGQVTIGGSSWSADFPTTDGSSPVLRAAFVARLDSSGTSLVYSVLLTGSGQEEVRSLAVTGSGEAVVTGWTNSSDFPTTPGALDTSYNGNFDAFVAALGPADGSLIFSSYLGGSQIDRGYGVQLDATDHIYLTGPTRSANFPTTPGAYDTSFGGGTCDFEPCDDAFVAKLTPDGSALVYSSFLGSDNTDEPRALALDPAGRVYVSGRTLSPAFPTTADAFDDQHNGGSDAFLAVLDATGSDLVYGSFFGAADTDEAHAVDRRCAGETYLAGKTRSAAFPTTPGAYDTQHNGDYDVFALKLLTPIDPITGVTAVSDAPTPLGQATTFTATLAAPADACFNWTFGDGNGATGATAVHTYADPGSYVVTLTATNAISSASTTLTVTITTSHITFLPAALRQ